MASLILNFGAKLRRVVSLRTRCPISIELEAGWASGPVCSHWRRETFLLFAGKVMELCYLDPPSRSIVTDYEISCLASFMGAEDHNDRSQWPRGLMCRSATSRLLGLRFRIPPRTWMTLCCEFCMLLSRGLCNGPIPRSEESYRMSLSVIRCKNNALHLQWISTNRSV